METGMIVYLADLSVARGPFTGKEIDYRLPCTETQHQTCQIIQHLSIWNEFLCYVGLELREVPEAGGQLSVVSVSEHYRGLSMEHGVWQYQAATLVNWLLRTHHCIIALEVSEFMVLEYESLMCDALQCNTSILTLRLPMIEAEGFIFSKIRSYDRICSVIASLTHLNKIELTAAQMCPATLVASLPKLILTTTSLTVLRIPKLRMYGRDVHMLLRAIGTNCTLRDLSLHFCVISSASQSCRDEFADFLKNYCCLTTLEIYGDGPSSERCLAFVLDCLVNNRTLTKVDLKSFRLDQASAELVAKVVAENSVLRAFNLTDLRAPIPKEIFDSWLPAFKKNETLEEITLPLGIYELHQWQNFLQTLTGKRKMRKVAIEARVNGQTNLSTLHRELRQYGVVDMVFLEPFVVRDSLDMLDCEAIREVHVSSYGGQPTVPLWNTIHLLSSLSHITSVRLVISEDDLDSRLSSKIADYIQTSSTLKKIHFSAGSTWSWLRRGEPHWKAIFESLSKNSSIKEVSVKVSRLSCEEMDSLADAVLSSQSIRTCNFVLGRELEWFARKLGDNIANNYSITNASLRVGQDDLGHDDLGHDDLGHDDLGQSEDTTAESWFAVMDTARRNASLVSRAAQVLSGRRCDRYCFSGLEQVYQHRPLLEHLAEVMSLSVSDTVSMVRDALRSVEDMHGFMKVAGVVRDRVVCRPRQDGHMQLDDLNEHCWSLVRRFLRLDDVLIDSATSS